MGRGARRRRRRRHDLPRPHTLDPRAMIPAAFDYTRAATLAQALELVAGADPSIRVLAGGQSLIPLMKLRLARPERLVDLGRLEELRGVRGRPGGGLAIG